MSMDSSRLQISLEEGERWRRTLSITIPGDLVKAERAAALRKISSQVRLPGFRAGKVPSSVIEKRFGATLDREMMDRVIGEAYRGVLQERDLRPISEGEVSAVEFKEDQSLAFNVSFDIAPALDLRQLDGFEVRRERMNVGDEEIQRVLERLREQQGTWVPQEAGQPEEGNQVSVRIHRLDEEGGRPRAYEFVLGRSEAIPEVEAAIRSLEPGQDGEFTVTFPEDFPDEARRGEQDRLQIFLDGRKELELPEVDDAFASTVGDFETLDQLRERIRSDLEEEADEAAEGSVRSQILAQLVERNPFDVPVSMIDQYIHSLLGEEQSLTADQRAEARAQLGDQAERAVKRFLIIDELARTHSLQASPDEVDARIEQIATRSSSSPGEVYSRLQRSGRLERLEQEITEDKVFERLKAGSTLVDAG